MRTPVRDMQLAEQLECRRSYPGPCCSLLWSRTSTFQFLVLEDESLVFKVFFQGRVHQRCTFLRNAFMSRLWSRSLISPFLAEAFKIFAQDRVQPLLRTFQLVFMKTLVSLVKVFFAFSPTLKKRCEVGSALWVGTECGLYFTHPASSCGLLGRRRRRLDPHRLRARAILEEVAVRPLAVVPAVGTALTAARWLWGYGCGSLWLLRGKSGPAWRVFPGLPSYAVVGAAAGADCAWGRLLVMEAFGRISSSTLPASSRCSHLEIWTSPSPSYLSVPLVFECYLWSTSYCIRGSTVETCSSRGFGRISAFSTLRRTRILRRLFSIRFEWRSGAQSMPLVAVSLSAARTLESGHYFYK